MALTREEKAEMVALIREERASGRPEVAIQIQYALDKDMAFEDTERYEALPPQPKEGGPGSSKKLWDQFAFAHSDFDEEVILGSSKSDLIAMLKAHGIIEG